MKKEISNTRLILAGHLIINLPVLAMLLGLPMLTWWLSSGIESLGYRLIIIAAVFLVSFKLAWVWWSILITKWRIWAFSMAKEDNWIHLKKLAIETYLIWQDGIEFEQSEVRSPEEHRRILQIKERIFELQQIEEIKNDLKTPQEVSFHFNNKEISIELLIRLFLSVVAICSIIFFEVKLIGIVLLLLVLFFGLNNGYLKHFNRRDKVLILNNAGIALEIPEPQFIKWSEVDFLIVNKDDKQLEITFNDAKNRSDLKIKLYYIAIKDYDQFMDCLDVFMERHRIRAYE